MKGTPRFRQMAAMSSTGWIKPKTLETWLQITASVSGVIRRSKAAVTASASNSGAAATEMLAPRASRGRVTALCS